MDYKDITYILVVHSTKTLPSDLCVPSRLDVYIRGLVRIEKGSEFTQVSPIPPFFPIRYDFIR